MCVRISGYNNTKINKIGQYLKSYDHICTAIFLNHSVYKIYNIK